MSGANSNERWSRRLNKWHDEEGPYHLQKSDGSPACGARYYTMAGPHREPALESHKCFRCRRIAENQKAKGKS